MKNVLVTGCCGFIGTNLCIRLHSLGYNVIGIDNFFANTHKNYNAIKDQITFFNTDVSDYDSMGKILDTFTFDLVYPLAVVNITESEKYPDLAHMVNVESLEYLFNKLHNKKVVFTSSCSIYGNQVVFPIKESSISLPVGVYANTKMQAEYRCSLYNNIYIARLSNVYGYFQTTDNQSCGIIGQFLDKIYKYIPIKIYGDGSQTRDYMFVDDTVSVLCKMGNIDTKYRIYNVSEGKELSVLDLVRTMEKIIGRHINREFIEPRRTIDAIKRRWLDHSRMLEIHKPLYDIKDGIERTNKWYTNITD